MKTVIVTESDVKEIDVEELAAKSKFEELQEELDKVNAERDALSIKARELSAELESMRVSNVVSGLSAEQKERLRKALA